MINHFITKRSFGAHFLFLVIKPLVTVYHRYAILLRPISPSSKKIGVASLNKLLLHNSCRLNFYHLVQIYKKVFNMVVYLQPFPLFMQYFNQNSESVVDFIISYHRLPLLIKYLGLI